MAIIVTKKGSPVTRVIEKSNFELEQQLQQYVYDHPEAIPVEDKRLLVTARELQTESGAIDAFAVDVEGGLYIVETKLYRNPDKRTVVAQALDYGASLWRHGDFDQILFAFDEAGQRQWNTPFRKKMEEFFSLQPEEVEVVIDSMRQNFSDGRLKFVVLMDELEDRLKDLITYVNENSEFDIYAVQIELYNHEEFEIVIPKLFGAEIRKVVGSRKIPGKRWTWESLKERLGQQGSDEVEAAQAVIDWTAENGVEIDWVSSQRGGFVFLFRTERDKGFIPFVLTGDGKIEWGAPRQRDKSPRPFDKRENRAKILERLKDVNGAVVDFNNVDGFNGLRLPLRALANQQARDKFFSICLWIQEALRTGEC
jgi:hypothetical protein